LNKNVWKSFIGENIDKAGKIFRKTLNNDQIVEYDLIKNLSEKLIIDNYDTNPKFHYIRKSGIGYNIYKFCSLKSKKFCRWIINININTNEAILSCNKQCGHKNSINHKCLTILII